MAQDLKNIFTLRTPEDAAKISALAQKGQKMIDARHEHRWMFGPISPPKNGWFYNGVDCWSTRETGVHPWEILPTGDGWARLTTARVDHPECVSQVWLRHLPHFRPWKENHEIMELQNVQVLVCTSPIFPQNFLFGMVPAIRHILQSFRWPTQPSFDVSWRNSSNQPQETLMISYDKKTNLFTIYAMSLKLRSRKLRESIMKSLAISGTDWLEVPTIYVWPMEGNIPTKYGLIWYNTSILGSWNFHWRNNSREVSITFPPFPKNKIVGPLRWWEAPSSAWKWRVR